MTPRLDQLRLPDETKVGLTLMVGYMLLDASQTYSLGGWHILKWLAGVDATMRQTGVLQLLMLAALSIALMVWQVRFSHKRLQLRRIEEVDAKVTSETDYLSAHVARVRVRFFVTANMGDTNAFCMWTGGTPWIVLGGGLRVLFRKNAERAQAIVGHECAHVAGGDTKYILIAWHVFNAYALLTIGYFAITQALFWLRVPQILPSYQSNGQGMIELLRQNYIYIFRNGFPGLISLAGLALALRHLTRLREYRADERAAQAGLRLPLISTLNALAQQTPRPRWRHLFMFHPTAGERARRLLFEEPWAKTDLPFLATLAFLAARIDEHIDVGGGGVRPSTNSINDAITLALDELANHPMSAISVVLPTALLFIAVVNVYRASTTQVKIGETLGRRLPTVLPAFIALFLGSLVGDLTSWGQIMILSDISESWTLTNAVDSAFANASLAALPATFLLLGVTLVAPRMLKYTRKPGWGQLWNLSCWTLLATFILQLVANVLGILIGISIGGNVSSWDISWMPSSSEQIVPGFPSLLQLFAYFVSAIAALQVFKLYPGRITKSVAAKVEPSWLVTDQNFSRTAS